MPIQELENGKYAIVDANGNRVGSIDFATMDAAVKSERAILGSGATGQILGAGNATDGGGTFSGPVDPTKPPVTSIPTETETATNPYSGLSTSNIVKAIKSGEITSQQGYEALLGKTNYTPERAQIELQNAGINYTPSVSATPGANYSPSRALATTGLPGQGGNADLGPATAGSGGASGGGGGGGGGGVNPADVGAKPYSFSEARDFVKNQIWTKEQYDAYVTKWEKDPDRQALELSKLPSREPSTLDRLGIGPTQFALDPANFGKTRPFDLPSGNTIDLENAYSGGQNPEGIGYARDPVTGAPRAANITIGGQGYSPEQLASVLKQRKVFVPQGASMAEMAAALDADARMQQLFEGQNPKLKPGQYQEPRNAMFPLSQSYHDASTKNLEGLAAAPDLSKWVTGLESFAGGGSMIADERIVGIGMESKMPRFELGEAGPEMLQIEPIGSKRGGASVQKPDKAAVLRALAKQTSKRVKLAMPVMA
jgi:hypothetical protein